MTSVFDLFSIGIGPSSSHTVGPMKAAREFVEGLAESGRLDRTARIGVALYGSLALTGAGHGTVDAVLVGLEGAHPRTVQPETVPARAAMIRTGGQIRLNGTHEIAFAFDRDFQLHKQEFLPKHANGMRFDAFDAHGQVVGSQVYYSIGGGFIVTDEQYGHTAPSQSVPYPFDSAEALLSHCRREGRTIAQIVTANEIALGRSEEAVRATALEIAHVMKECVESGCRHEGTLPGGLNVRRRAPALFRKLITQQIAGRLDAMLWPMLYAMAVNEENAAGGRVVTAPTNGAAGIVPAVLTYYRNFYPRADEEGVVTFLLTAGAIGLLYKMNASISGAEVGCQGEVGVASSMAAGAYAAVIGGTLEQIENAAEIAMEHHLGMTCDPVGGLVQIPCIERNGVAAEQAIKVAQLALLEDGQHKVSLDTVIQTMFQTGKDMKHTYKETSLGGLAITVNVPEC
ncbi:L-serine ammonia-lyase [Gulbenkiania mobilis]|uniref:L-serine ammonia-lyase n=1 Tax=Gulbenkiania mobilis TaxID=397457 RepID=UPI0006BBCB4D|nr:L-serine ammonia-lyase [Gulbenkiania mobilis]